PRPWSSTLTSTERSDARTRTATSRPPPCLAAFAMPSRITDDAASSTEGGTSSRSPSIDHVAGRCQRSRTLRSSSSIGCAVAGGTSVRVARTSRTSRARVPTPLPSAAVAPPRSVIASPVLPSFCMAFSRCPPVRLVPASAHLRSLPPSQGMPSLLGLVLISVVRGGGLNPPLRGAGLPGTRPGPRALLREGETPGAGLRPDHGARQHLGEVEHLGAAAAGP